MHRSMRDSIVFAREKGLSMSQIGALFELRHRSGGVTELGEHLGVSSAAASQMLERLVQMNYVARTEDPNDRRTRRLVLTASGQRLLEEAIQVRERWMEELVERFNPAEKAQINAAVQLLIAKLPEKES